MNGLLPALQRIVMFVYGDSVNYLKMNLSNKYLNFRINKLKSLLWEVKNISSLLKAF